MKNNQLTEESKEVSKNLQEVSSVSSNENSLELTKNNIFNILKIFLIIFSVSFFSFIIFLISMFFISPRIDAKIFNFLNLKKFEESCYIKIYEKSNSNADLYNIILFEKQYHNYEKELEYIRLLKSKKDYAEFCNKMDLTGIDFCKNQKNQYIYFADVDSYFESRIVICKFNLNLKCDGAFDILTSILENLKGDKLTEYSFYEYMNLILNSKTLSKNEKVQLVMEVSNKDMISFVMQRINLIQDEILKNDDEIEKILLQN